MGQQRSRVRAVRESGGPAGCAAAAAALCQLASAVPVVVSLPSGNRKVQLQLQLTVPSRSRILGWQPADAAVSAEAQALSLSSDVPQLDVLVLVRCQAGDYLPVTVSLLSDSPVANEGDAVAVSLQVSLVRLAPRAAFPCAAQIIRAWYREVSLTHLLALCTG